LQQQQAASFDGTLICTALTMKPLFSPCTRYRDLEESRGFVPPEWMRELNLNVSTDEFLGAERGFTYADLYTMLGNGETITWLTPHAAIVLADGRVQLFRREFNKYRFRFTVDGKEIVAWARSIEALSEICDVVLRLVAASVVHSVLLRQLIPVDGALINAASLAYLMEQCQSLKAITLQNLVLDEDHCRVLGAYSRPDLDIVLTRCKFKGAGASALAEVLGRNEGPTRLDYYEIDNFLLANGLRGNSRLKYLIPHLSSSLEDAKRQVLAIASALTENEGLIDLNILHDFTMSDETWDALCDSLKTHPTLQVLKLGPIYHDAATIPAIITSRVQVLLGMMKVNTSILRIRLRYQYSQHEIFRQSVVPYLETNRFRLNVRAIQKNLPIPYRAKVLGRALLAVRTDPNRFWMLISGNAEVAFPSTTATTTPTASLPTPAIAATTSNTDGASTAATASATATVIRAASSTDASAVDSAATPTAR
jgi:hypothetical protein